MTDLVDTLPDQLWVEPWPDDALAHLGHDVTSAYVERFWLGVLGPTTLLLLRRLAGELEISPSGVAFELPTWSLAMGLGYRNGRSAPLPRAVERLCQFGVAQRDGFTLYVRRWLPHLNHGQLRRLPPETQKAHEAWTEPARAAVEDPERRARQLALTLLQLGENRQAVSRQLEQWRVPPLLTDRAVRWASRRLTELTTTTTT
jgi:hypothetical protein